MADIYSTIPNEIKPTTTLDDRKKVVAYMKNNIGKYETAKNISANVGFKYKDNSVHLRKVITELIYFNHIPIIANSRGFKITRSMKELISYSDSLKLRMKGFQRRINAVDAIIYSNDVKK